MFPERLPNRRATCRFCGHRKRRPTLRRRPGKRPLLINRTLARPGGPRTKCLEYLLDTFSRLEGWLVFPHADTCPTRFTKSAIGVAIALDVAVELRDPPVPIVDRNSAV